MGQGSEVFTSLNARMLRNLLKMQRWVPGNQRDLAREWIRWLLTLCKPWDSELTNSLAQDLQQKYEIAKDYKIHIDQVGRDRSLEEFCQVRKLQLNATLLWSFTHSMWYCEPKAQSPIQMPGNPMCIFWVSWSDEGVCKISWGPVGFLKLLVSSTRVSHPAQPFDFQLLVKIYSTM